MQWSHSPLYAQDLQVFVNWCLENTEHYPDTWKLGDGTYHGHERSYKDQLCTEFAKAFGGLPPYSGDQLRTDALALLSLKNVDMGGMSLLYSVEISRLNEWLRNEAPEKVWKAFAVLYSSASDEVRYTFFVDSVEGFLKARGSPGRVAPPMLTFWLAYYSPQSEVFFKPKTTNAFYEKYGKNRLAGNTVQRYLALKSDALRLRADLKAAGLATADMIDVQSFIWVVGLGYAWD